MSVKDMLLAFLVVLVWGFNFVVIKIGLQEVPPMLLGALRFTLAALPAIFFIQRPQMPLRLFFSYGLTMAFGQFALLFTAMNVGMPAGLASLVLQVQAFFTIALAVVFLRERFHRRNAVGLLIAACGLAAISLTGDSLMTLPGFVLTICAAACWAAGNIITKKIGKVNLLGLVVWSSLIPPIPFLMLSYWTEGPERIVSALVNISAVSVTAIAYLGFIATILGYSLWNRLMSIYPASQIAPFSLLVPISGMTCAALMLDEALTPVQLAGSALVLAGLLVNLVGDRLLRKQLSSAARG